MMDCALNLTSNNNSNGSEFDRHFSCYDLEATPQWALVIHAAILCVVFVASVILNVLVIVLVVKFKQLRHSAAIVSLSLVTADLFMDFTTHFPAVVSTVAKRWMFGEIGCSMFGTWALCILLTRLCIMAVLAFDRFARVKFPFSYKRRARYIVVGLIMAAWGVPAFIAYPVMHATDFRWIGFRQHIPTCHINCPFDPECRGVYGSLLTGAYFIGAVIPTVLYSWLYHRARKLTPTAIKLGRISIKAASGAVISIPAARLENKDSKRILTFILIFVTFFLTGLPTYIVQIVRTNYDAFCSIPIFLQFIVIDIFSLSTALDPLLIMRDRDFRVCLKMLFCRCKKTPAVVPEAEESSSFDFFDESHYTGRRSTLESIIYRVSSTLSLDQTSRSRRNSVFTNQHAASSDHDAASYHSSNGNTLRVAVEHCGTVSPAESLPTLHEMLEEDSDHCSASVVIENSYSVSCLQSSQKADQKQGANGNVFDIAFVYPKHATYGISSRLCNSPSMNEEPQECSQVSFEGDSCCHSIPSDCSQEDVPQLCRIFPQPLSVVSEYMHDCYSQSAEAAVLVGNAALPECSEDEAVSNPCATKPNYDSCSADCEISSSYQLPTENTDTLLLEDSETICESIDSEVLPTSKEDATAALADERLTGSMRHMMHPGSKSSSFSSWTVSSQNSLVESTVCEVD